MTERTVTLAVNDGVATLCIRNPGQRNAMSLSMWRRLGELTESLEQRPDVRVVLLRGEGREAFISGADIKEFDTLRSTPDGVARYEAAVSRAQAALARGSRPVIAQIAGLCYGGGIGLAAACDLRYAAQSTRFCMPAARLGLGYAASGVRRLVAVMGGARVAELFMTARVFDGDEAQRIGFVHAAHPDGHLDDAVGALARRMTQLAPLTLRAAKLALRHIQGDASATEASVNAAVSQCFGSDDYREGQQAFREKRTPVFIGS